MQLPQEAAQLRAQSQHAGGEEVREIGSSKFRSRRKWVMSLGALTEKTNPSGVPSRHASQFFGGASA